MQTLMRINRITWQFRTRLIVAYFSLFAAIGFSFFIPFIFGNAIDSMVIVTDQKKIIGRDFAPNTLVWFAVALLAASIARDFSISPGPI